jgi:hypothetical protein
MTMTEPIALYPDHQKDDGCYEQCPHCGTANLFRCYTSNLEIWTYCAVHRIAWCIWHRTWGARNGSLYIETQTKGQRRNQLMLRSMRLGGDEQQRTVGEVCDLGP